MNGISYNTIYQEMNQWKQTTCRNKKATQENISSQGKKSNNEAKIEAYQDTVEIDGRNRQIPQAGYQKPIVVAKRKEQEFKALDKNGIQEGIELSKEAKDLLEELRKKYGEKMDIFVANWSTDEEQEYYAKFSEKQFNALLAPEALEAMAKDEKIREQYESIMDSVEGVSNQLKEELGEDVQKIQRFTVTMDQNGKVNYLVSLWEQWEKHKDKAEDKKQKEDKIEKEENNIDKNDKKEESGIAKRIDLQADSITDLIQKIRERIMQPTEVESEKLLSGRN